MKRIKHLLDEARKLFPQSKNLQRQWVRKVQHLEDTGRHAKFTGGFRTRDEKWV